MTTAVVRTNRVESRDSGLTRLPARSGVRMGWRRFRRNRLAVVGLVIIVMFLLAALFAQIIAPYDPDAGVLRNRRALPSREHLLGADELGRDILSRLLFGARIALQVGVSSVVLGLAVGSVIGLVAGFFGRLVDNLLMRAMDVLLAFPYLLLAIVIVAVLGPNLRNATIAIAVSTIPGYARLMRGTVLSIREREYIEAARSSGAGVSRIIIRHILPNSVAPMIVYSSLQLARAILAEAGLSFLGLGVQPPTPSWGTMISTGRDYLQAAPHVATAPGVAIMLLVLGFNLAGDGFRDALDPRLRN